MSEEKIINYITKHELFAFIDVLEIGTKIMTIDEEGKSGYVIWEKKELDDYDEIIHNVYEGSLIDVLEDLELECMEEPYMGLEITNIHDEQNPILRYEAGTVHFKEDEDIEDLKIRVAKRYMEDAACCLNKALNALEYGEVTVERIIPKDDPFTRDIEWFRYKQPGMNCKARINELLKLLVEKTTDKLSNAEPDNDITIPIEIKANNKRYNLGQLTSAEEVNQQDFKNSMYFMKRFLDRT